jgi:DNA primase
MPLRQMYESGFAGHYTLPFESLGVYNIPTMQNSIDEIKRKLDIVEFIGSRITLKKAGRNFKGLCPFHNEKSPSFTISPDRQIWHCFGACQEGGDVIKFLMKWDNITFYEALQELAEKTGVTLEKTSVEDRVWKVREQLFKINALAAQYYHYLLQKHKVGEAAREYLQTRSISDKLTESFYLGYSPSSWDSLLKFMKSKKYSTEDMLQAGLIIKSDRGSFYDRFRGRLMFPLQDTRGNILGFSGRLLTSEKQAKYINSPETPIYRKRETLFGIHITKDHIKKENCAIIVEGEFDMISLFKEGITNVVAVKGSAVTREQLQIIGRLTKHITLSLDADFAGGETAKRAIEDAEKMDFDIDVAVYDFGKDPDEAVKNDPIAFKKLIKKPTPIYDFIIDKAVKKYSQGDVFSKKEVAAEVIPLISSIQNPIVKSHYFKKLGTILEVDPDSVLSLATKYVKTQDSKQNKQFINKQKPQKNREELVEEYILSYILKQKKSPYSPCANGQHSG